MDELKKELKLHMAQDREDFRAINDKLDVTNSKLDQVIGQWKVVGAVVGTVVGFVSSLLLGYL